MHPGGSYYPLMLARHELDAIQHIVSQSLAYRSHRFGGNERTTSTQINDLHSFNFFQQTNAIWQQI